MENVICAENGTHRADGGRRNMYELPQCVDSQAWALEGNCVTRRKLQTPGSAEEPKRQETPTKNPNDRRSAQLTYKAPGTIERAAHPGGGQERGLRTGGR